MRARALATTMTMAFSGFALVGTPAALAKSGGSGSSGGASASQAPSSSSGSTGSTGSTGSASAQTGGRQYNEDNPVPQPTVPGDVAQIVDGIAYAPADAPPAVQQAIWAANTIVGDPYIYGGGHQSFIDDGYDCSGTVSFALHGGNLLAKPRDSSDFFRYGAGGAGQWITIYTNSGHAYMTIAGVRLDTSQADDPGGKPGPEWRPLRQSNKGFRVRHPIGY